MADLVNLPRTSTGNVVMVVLIDHFLKWVAAVPLRNKTAQATAAALEHQILLFLPGVPLQLLTDNGSEFWSEWFEQTLQWFGITHVRASHHTRFSNGCCEQVNRTLIQLIRSLCPDSSYCDKYLGRVVIVYNHAYHSQICITSVAKVGEIRPHQPLPPNLAT